MDMKEYMTPEMEVVMLKYQTSLLSASDGSQQSGGLDDEITEGDA